MTEKEGMHMRKGEVRKQSIIEVSEQLFSTKGYLETTVDDILAQLQCSKGSFYHYFDSKLSVLSAICEEKVQRWFDTYRQMRVTSTRERLDALLYCAQPFRPEEEDFLFMMLRLRIHGESIMMEGTLRAAQRALFKPELANLLMVLNETGAARIARPHLEDLVFEVHTAFYDEICACIMRCVRDGNSIATPFTQAVASARFLWERVLDMDYGSVEIVKIDEMLPVAERIVQRLRSC